MDPTHKKSLTETDIRTKFITPPSWVRAGAGWDRHTQLREEVCFTKGRVIFRGKTVKRGEVKRAGYILFGSPRK